MPRCVVGLDGYSKGWVAVSVIEGRFQRAELFRSFAKALEAFPEADVIAVDIPIGLIEGGFRQADLAAKAFLGRRHNAVFLTPPREVLEQSTHQAASTRLRSLTGNGLPRQSYDLRHKILEVDELVSSTQAIGTSLPRIVEVHPEVSFRALAGEGLTYGKKTWGGVTERRRLLEGQALVIPDNLGEANKASPDDVLDATVAAWSALRVAQGEARSLPEEPERDDRGRPVAIWY